jgi:uncharacterized membrane protein
MSVSQLPEGKKARLESIDFIRGLAMIAMALDHTRDYFGSRSLKFNLSDPSLGDGSLFFTRWLTHFAPPSFFFLAGVSAYFVATQSAKHTQLIRWLVTRGLWLIFLELTIVYLGWHFNFRFEIIRLQTIFALGVSMIALGAISLLPLPAVGFVSAILIFGHNVFDKVSPSSFGAVDWIWNILHVPESRIGSSPSFVVVYPVLPWIGVMAAGFAIAPIFSLGSALRRKILAISGVLLLTTFFILRSFNSYGDLVPWETKSTIWGSTFSFLNCTKYPPSLSFLLMTIGQTFLLLALAECVTLNKIRFVAVFGSVQLFFYLVHLYLIHGAALLLAWYQTGDFRWLLESFVDVKKPFEYGFGLLGVYVTTLILLLAFYPVCKRYAAFKRRCRGGWTSYL